MTNRKDILVKTGLGVVGVATVAALAVAGIKAKEKPGVVDTACASLQSDGGYSMQWSAVVQPSEGPKYIDTAQAEVLSTEDRKVAVSCLGLAKRLRNATPPPDANK